MSKAEWYGDYGYVPLTDNYEEILTKKEQMQREFINMCSKKSQSNASTSSNIMDASMDISEKIDRGTKNTNMDTVITLKNKLSNAKNMISKLQKDNDKIKRARFKYIEENKSKSLRLKIIKILLNLY